MNWAQLLSKQSSLCPVLASGLGQLQRDGEWHAVRRIFSAADTTKPPRTKLEERWRTSKGSDLPGLTSSFNTAVLQWVLWHAWRCPGKCIFLVEISLFPWKAISSVVSILCDFPAWPAAISICLCLWEGPSLNLCTLGRGETPGLHVPYFKSVILGFKTNAGSCLFGAARWGCLEWEKGGGKVRKPVLHQAFLVSLHFGLDCAKIASHLHGGSTQPCSLGSCRDITVPRQQCVPPAASPAPGGCHHVVSSL